MAHVLNKKKGNFYLIKKEKASGINNVFVLCTSSVPGLCRNGGYHIPRSILTTKDGAPISSCMRAGLTYYKRG